MPSRSVKNRTRGKQRGDLPKKAAPAPGELVQNYDGRANTNAGEFERNAQKDDIIGDGYVAHWKK